MNHDSQNNFRSYYRGYPWNCNSIDIAEGIENISDETIICNAHDQLEKILTMKPFDPEEFGFKDMKNGGFEKGSNVMRQKNNGYGNWEITLWSKYEDEKLNVLAVHDLYIPNDLAGRIILTGLGIVPRRDLDENGNGCVNDDNLDGICELCESQGACMNKLLPQ